jgi:predicted GTPase
MSDPVISWTRPMLERFKKAYATAVTANADTFRFDGNEFVRSYARYLIEYLEERLPK